MLCENIACKREGERLIKHGAEPSAVFHIKSQNHSFSDIFFIYCTLRGRIKAMLAYCIVHTVLISYITVLCESYSRVMQLIGQIQQCYENNPTCVTL